MATETKFGEGRRGLRLDAPQAGDIVTVRIKRQPNPPSPFDFFAMQDEADNPQHYRMTGIWRVIATNGGQAVVEGLDGYTKGRREMWPIALHEWFEASDLASALGVE